MEIILGFVGLVVFGFVVATLWGAFDAVRLHRFLLRDPNEVHKMGNESLKSGNIKAAVLRFHHASKMGHAGSAFNMGLLYGNGMGLEKNMAEAFRWFKLAADRGLAQGQLNTGGLFLHGDGVEKDLTKAYHYFRLAADQGLEPAIDLAEEFEETTKLAWYDGATGTEDEWRERGRAVIMHLRGVGTIDGLERAVAAGDRETALNLALMYLSGDKVPKDGDRAYEWARKAVEIGNAKAAMVVDMMRPSEEPTLAKLQPSFDLYDRAEGGDKASEYEIGMRYLEGVGVEKNPATAALWFLMSYKYPASRAELDKLPREFWPEELRDEELPAV
jgi:TPR repeat protein